MEDYPLFGTFRREICEFRKAHPGFVCSACVAKDVLSSIDRGSWSDVRAIYRVLSAVQPGDGAQAVLHL